jgi:ABC-type iron transport system FetAB ATPase subunit
MDRLIAKFEELFGLTKGILNNKWNTLSGGERQRAAVICGLFLALSVDYQQPNNYLRRVLTSQMIPNVNEERPNTIVLFDEPTAACDLETTLKIEKVFEESLLTILMITHDEAQARRISHRRIILQTNK